VLDRVRRLLFPPATTRAWLTQPLTVSLLLRGPIVAAELIMNTVVVVHAGDELTAAPG
jgi:hypothetical protein